MRFGMIAAHALRAGCGLLYTVLVTTSFALAKNEGTNDIPRGQLVRPGPALKPDEAIARMKVPEGFKVECVASEPEVVNPTSFTFDDRGRIWVTESVEYPRRGRQGEGPRQNPGVNQERRALRQGHAL